MTLEESLVVNQVGKILHDAKRTTCRMVKPVKRDDGEVKEDMKYIQWCNFAI